MPSAEKREYPDELLVRYLLGSLSEEQSERLDERSVVDEEFAWRLNAIEDDLVDSYVRGDLSGETLARFKAVYQSTSKKLEKVDFAKVLFEWTEKAPLALSPVGRSRSGSSWFGVYGPNLGWGLAVATIVLCIASAYLLVDNTRLRKSGIDARDQQTIQGKRAHDLEKQLEDQRSANAETKSELERLQASMSGSRVQKKIAFLLLPQTRGAGSIATVTVPPATDQVTLKLKLESDDFRLYRVELRDSATRQIVWRGQGLRGKSELSYRIVSFRVPASLLKQQNYILELSSVSAKGGAELLSGYPIKVVLE